MTATDRAYLDWRIADSLGVDIEPGDTVTIARYGGTVRRADVGRQALVVGWTGSGNVRLTSLTDTHDPIARGRAVTPGVLLVARRDGKPGHQGNAQ